MKKILFAATLFISIASFSQTYETGDKELDKVLTEVNTNAKTDLKDFKEKVAKTYSTTIEKVDKCLKEGMTPGDVVMAHEVSLISKKPIETVVTSYKKNKGKGWGVVAKEMGIKPGSPEFHKLKESTKNKKEKVKTNKGNSGKGNSGNSNGKGNGKGKK